MDFFKFVGTLPAVVRSGSGKRDAKAGICFVIEHMFGSSLLSCVVSVQRSIEDEFANCRSDRCCFFCRGLFRIVFDHCDELSIRAR